VSADTIVPGAASGAGGGVATIGYSDQVRLTPLTVGFQETQFLQVLNAENQELLQFGQPALWDDEIRQEHNVPVGPANPQALNRYSYVLNNPLAYTDPMGHVHIDRQALAYFAAKLATRATKVDRDAAVVGIVAGGITQVPVAVVDVLVCGSPLTWGCLGAIVVGEAIVGGVGYGAYQWSGGAKAAFFTDLANFINETLADPDYADLETFELEFLPPFNGQRGNHTVILVGYRADGTAVHINTNLSAPEGIANEANELLLNLLIQ
jgi:hypothetical protein